MKKKVLITILIICLLILPVTPISAGSKARTLKELRSELQQLKNKKTSTANKKQQTKNQISSAKNNIANNQNEIMDNQQKAIDATNEIAVLEEEIKNGKEELSNLIETYQVANGDNIYLEYIFEASSYEDLVYRYAIMEQILMLKMKK